MPGISTGTNSGSGDSSAGLTTARKFQLAFQVGGSGAQDQSADLTATTPPNNTLLYVALGVLALVSIISLFRRK